MTIADFCLFGAVTICLLTIGAAKAGGRREYDNRHPRDGAFYSSGWRARALGAHQNGMEGFAFFAAAVLLAELRGVDQRLVDGLAIAFIIARLTYVIAYIDDRPTLRSVIWSLGLLVNVALFCSPLSRP